MGKCPPQIRLGDSGFKFFGLLQAYCVIPDKGFSTLMAATNIYIGFLPKMSLRNNYESLSPCVPSCNIASNLVWTGVVGIHMTKDARQNLSEHISTGLDGSMDSVLIWFYFTYSYFIMLRQWVGTGDLMCRWWIDWLGMANWRWRGLINEKTWWIREQFM